MGKGATASACGLLQRQAVKASLLWLSGRNAPGNRPPRTPRQKGSVLCEQASLLHSQTSREPELPNSIPSSEQSNPSISRPFRWLVTYCF